MELREFVSETIIAIVDGVTNAITEMEAQRKIGRINPVWSPKEGEKVDWSNYTQPVEFDVAVTATDRLGTTGKGSIKIFNVGELGADGSKSRERSTVSRIKFSIPISLPAQHAFRHTPERRAETEPKP